jgi:hypothetical protein
VGSGITVGGFEPGTEVDKIITVLDTQLANGLGSSTGTADAANALAEAKRDYARQHSKK